MARELKSDQVKSRSDKLMLPNCFEEVEAFFFSQWVVFGSLMMFHAPPEIKGQVDIGQASLTSKAQVSLEIWR